MSLPQFFGDSVEEFLRDLSFTCRETPSLGLRVARSIEKLIDHLRAEEASQGLTLRDLPRDIECLESELEKLRSYREDN